MVGTQRRFRIIQEGLDRHRIGFKDVAQALGVSYTLVHRTARGLGNNRRVLRHFLLLGIPAEALDLPKAMQAENHNTERVA